MGTCNKAQIKRILRDAVKPLFRSEDGSVAVEFAIIAPILATALIGVIDVGLLLYERSDVNSALRLAAQTAMSDPGTKRVTDILNTFKSQKQFSGSINFVYKAQRYCACAEDEATMKMTKVKIDCDSLCPLTNAMPGVYYKITGGTKYEGIFIQGYKISHSIEVQVE